MPSPLFKQFSRELKREALRAFEHTALGELFDDAYEVLEAYHRGSERGFHPIRDLAKRSPLTHFMRRAKAISKRGVVNELLRMGGEGGNDIADVVEQFARASKKETGDVIAEKTKELLREMGPIGQVIAALIGERKRSGAGKERVKRELNVMKKALQSFGFETLHEPTEEEPPTAREIEAAKRVLQAAGYTVLPPKRRGEQPTVLVGRGRSRHPEAVSKQVGGAKITNYGATRVRVAAGGQTQVVPKDDPLVTGEMIPVDSSNVHSIGYDLGGYPNGDLLVRFLGHAEKGGRSGPGPLYIYFNVALSVFQRFRHVASKGKFVWDELRIRGTVSGHQYDYKLEEGEGRYIPRKATLTERGEEYVPRTGMLTPGMKSLPRELVRPLSPAQYRKMTRGSLQSDRGRGRGGRSRSR